MQYLILFIVIIIRLLIAIGDTTIMAFLMIKRLAKNIFSPKPAKRKRLKPTEVLFLLSRIKLKYFILGALFSLVFVFLPSLFLIFIQDLPNPTQLSLTQPALTSKIYDRNGTLLYQLYADQNRVLVPLSEIPKNLVNATIAIEDKNFYKNRGFDLLAIARAAFSNLSGGPLQGGSTITQQLIKSTLLTPEKSLRRKIKEIILAFWAERIYTKRQVLEMYFNQVPYGGTAWGVEAAAQTYFGKHVKDLTLGESAFLASLPQAPTLYSPYGDNPNLWKKRQKEVLQKMTELHYITQEESLAAQKENLNFQFPRIPIHAPHFVMLVKDLLVKKYGLPFVEKGGIKVTTSLDLKIQEMAENIVKDEVEKNAYLNLTNGAALVTNPKNGDILSMVGSKDYSDQNGGNFNVTTALRQPGSSIKVVTYSAALSSGFTAATILDDSPVTFNSPGAPSYSPVNYDGKFHGPMSLRVALGNSINVPAVKTLAKIGLPTMVDLGKKMGITTWENPNQYGLSITLGGADVKMTDMATLYGTLANQGVRVDLNPILKIEDAKGTVVEEKKQEAQRRVLDEGIAFIISDVLADNGARAIEFGMNSPLNIPGQRASVKTGTSDNKRDNWTIGYASNFVVAVWTGNNDNSPMSQDLASGITGAAPIWHEIMKNLLSNSPKEKPHLPQNVTIKQCLGRIEYFIKGTENSINCAPPTPTPNSNL